MLTLGGALQLLGCSPLFFAAREGHLAVAQVLLEAGANKETRDTVREGEGKGGDLGLGELDAPLGLFVVSCCCMGFLRMRVSV